MARPEGAYRDRYGDLCRHPGGLYSESLSKVLNCMGNVTETIQPEAHPDTRGTAWPATASALEALLLDIDKHADDLKTILTSTAITTSPKKLKQERSPGL